jgi:hypothetical protein
MRQPDKHVCNEYLCNREALLQGVKKPVGIANSVNSAPCGAYGVLGMAQNTQPLSRWKRFTFNLGCALILLGERIGGFPKHGTHD